MESPAQLSRSSLSKLCFQTPNLQNLFPSSVASGHQPTCLPKSIFMESNHR